MDITTKECQCPLHAATFSRELNCKRPLNAKHVSEDGRRKNREKMEGING